MTKALLLGSGTQGLSLVRALSKAKCFIVLLCGSEHNYADSSRYVDKIIRTNLKDTSDDYLQQVEEILKNDGIDVVIPMGDSAASFVSKNLERLQRITHVKMPLYDNFLKGYDKNLLMSLCEEKGYPHPETVDLSKVALDDERLKAFPYPAMLKPNCTTGGRGMVEVFSYDEMKAKYETLHQQYGDYHLQRFVRAGGRQVKIQLYIDEDKNLVNSSVMRKIRWYPNKAGSNCCAVSIREPKIVEICYNILKDIDWVGFADFDAIEDPDTGELLIMEINPRVPACIQMAMVSGINWAEIIVNGYMNKPQKTYEYKEGEYLRHLGLEMLWFKHAESRRNTDPNWFRFFGKHIHYQDMSDWTDPMPFLKGTFHNIRKMSDPKFKNAKSLK
jgi:predicted ATP-grasp superfamily ATP-dependent carboligase